MKKMFETENGSIYYLEDNGFWIRKKSNGDISRNWVYLGSIDESKNPCFNGSDEYNDYLLYRELVEGDVLGLDSKFVPGKVPFGVWGIGPNDIRFQDGKLVSNLDLNETKVHVHVGYNITEVFEQ